MDVGLVFGTSAKRVMSAPRSYTLSDRAANGRVKRPIPLLLNSTWVQDDILAKRATPGMSLKCDLKTLSCKDLTGRKGAVGS